MQTISPAGRRFIEKWEECVLYVYDDKVPKRRINGKLRYPEWDGSRIVGTLTIGYGHTDAAGFPKISRGLRITVEQADEILNTDLQPCMKAVRSTVKVPTTQGQFDSLTSFTFNCGPGNLRKLVVGLNKGDYASMPRKFLQYTRSKGEQMRGLVNRRNGEIQLWNTPEDPFDAEAEEVFSPKAERDDPPKSMIESKTGNAAGGIGIATVPVVIDQIVEAKGKAEALGIWDTIVVALHNPLVIGGIVVVILAVFIWWDRKNKLHEEHV